MTVGAVIGHRLMLEEQGATFFSMTLVASLRDCIFLQELGTGRAMGIVTIRASHLAFLNGVV